MARNGITNSALVGDPLAHMVHIWAVTDEDNDANIKKATRKILLRIIILDVIVTRLCIISCLC